MPDLPVNIVGGSTFGRYKKISDEKTINMYISDNWLVSFAGWKKVVNFPGESQGRALFHSVRGNLMIAVIGNSVFRIDSDLTYKFLGGLSGTSSKVYIDENLNNQICIVDGVEAYIYNWSTDSALTAQNISSTYSYTPQYVSYHNTFFLISGDRTDTNPQNWYVFQRSTDTTITQVSSEAGGLFPLETKPDFVVGVHRLPGRSNNILVLGSSVCEVWNQVGGTQNYRRNSSFNIDSGCASRETIAASENFICWLGQNEENTRTIMMTDGADVKNLSTDGIDNLLSSVENVSDSTGFFFRQDGHLFYQLTFYNETDPFTLVYDFNTSQFSYLTDASLSNHPARQSAFFNDKLYFISIADGDLYETSTDIVQQIDTIGATEGELIPRIRICKTIRSANSEPFRINEFSFIMEQGVNDFYNMPLTVFGQVVDENDNPVVSEGGALVLSEDGYIVQPGDAPKVEMAISKNGCATFSNSISRDLNHQGKFRNRISWHRLGQANEITVMLRFYGLQRFVASNGVLEVEG